MLLVDELAVREYLISRIEGLTNIYDNWAALQTVSLIKLYIILS